MLSPCESCGAQRFRWNDEGHPVCAVCNTVQLDFEATGIDALDSSVHFSHRSLIERARIAQRKRGAVNQRGTSPRRRIRLIQRERRGVPFAEQLQSPAATVTTNLCTVYAAVGRAAMFLTEQTAGAEALPYVWRWLGALLTDRFSSFRTYVERAFEHGSGAVKLRIGASTIVAAVFLGILQARAELNQPRLASWHSLRFLEHLHSGVLSRFRDLLEPYVHCRGLDYRIHRRRLVKRARALVAMLGDDETKRDWNIDVDEMQAVDRRCDRTIKDIPAVFPDTLVQWLLENGSAVEQAGDSSSESTSPAECAPLLGHVLRYLAKTELVLVLDTVLVDALLSRAGMLELPGYSTIPEPLPNRDLDSLEEPISVKHDADVFFADTERRWKQHHESMWREVFICWKQLSKTSRTQPWTRALLGALENHSSTSKLWGTCPWHVTTKERTERRVHPETSPSRALELTDRVCRLFAISPRTLERYLIRRALELDITVHSMNGAVSGHDHGYG